VTRHNLRDLSVEFPLGVLTTVTGVSGSGKSSLVSQALVELVAAMLGHPLDEDDADSLEHSPASTTSGKLVLPPIIKRLVRVDQRPIGRTPRSDLATYTGLFDPVRKLFAATRLARARRYDAGRCRRRGRPHRRQRPAARRRRVHDQPHRPLPRAPARSVTRTDLSPRQH
jgi:excinuclease ABC subunit A